MYFFSVLLILAGATLACFSVISSKRAAGWDIAGIISPVVFTVLFLQQVFIGNKLAIIAASLITAGFVVAVIASKT